MESTSNNLKRLCFSGLSDEYPVWSTRFRAFFQTKGVLTGDDLPTNPPGRFPDGASDEQHAAHGAHKKAVIDIQKRNTTLVLPRSGAGFHKLDVDRA